VSTGPMDAFPYTVAEARRSSEDHLLDPAPSHGPRRAPPPGAPGRGDLTPGSNVV
jgi:hypothetical protein